MTGHPLLVALGTRLLLTSGLPVLLPPMVMACWGREHAQAAVFAMGLCGWLALWTMGAHVPLLRALMLAPPGAPRQRASEAGWRLAGIQSFLMLACAALWQLVAERSLWGASAWSPLVTGWVWSLAAVWATFPLANAVLAHWYAANSFATGNAWALLPRMGVVLAVALLTPVSHGLGWGIALAGLAAVAWLLCAAWLLPLRRLAAQLQAMPLAATATPVAQAPTVRTLWRENAHYLLWAAMMACYGPLPLVWAATQGPDAVLLLGTALSVSGMLALYLGAACVPWMVEAQKHLHDAAYLQRHRHIVWRHVAWALLVSLGLCWAVLPWYGHWLLGPQQAQGLVLYTSALLVAQAARLLSLATTQCAAALRQERLVHPAAFIELLVVLLLMFTWAAWPGALGFVAALCAGFAVRGLTSITLEARWVSRYWLAGAVPRGHVQQKVCN